jgi:hypothetical protein
MYDNHPVKKRLSAMNVGDLERVYLNEITFTYLWNILLAVKRESGFVFTTRRNRKGGFVSVIRLS